MLLLACFSISQILHSKHSEGNPRVPIGHGCRARDALAHFLKNVAQIQNVIAGIVVNRAVVVIFIIVVESTAIQD